MSELVKVSIDVNKLHKCTTAVVIESGSLTQISGNTLLRVDTMKGIMQEEVDRVNKELYRLRDAPKTINAKPKRGDTSSTTTLRARYHQSKRSATERFRV